MPALPTLSVFPNLLPTIVVHSDVSRYLCRGADLMRSGILSVPSESNLMVSRGVVAVVVRGNPQPFAVGFVTDGTTDSSNVGPGSRGVGVRIVSCYGDDLWRNQKKKPPKKKSGGEDGGGIRSPFGSWYDDGDYGNVGFREGKLVVGIVSSVSGGGEEAAAAAAAEDDDAKAAPPPPTLVADEDAGDAAEGSGGTDAAAEAAGGDDDDDDDGGANGGRSTAEPSSDVAAAAIGGDVDPSSTPPSPPDPRDVLLEAFRISILALPKNVFPLPVSTYYAKYLLPSRPPGIDLDVKGAGYKGVGSFLLEQSETGIVSVKPSADGRDKCAFVTGVDRNHLDLRDARRALKSRREAKGGEAPDDDGGKAAKTKLAVVDLYVIPPHIVSLLRLDEGKVKALNAKSEARRGTGYLTVPEARDILDAYVADNDLIDEFDPSSVRLDGPLCDALYKPTKRQLAALPPGEKFRYPERVSRKEMNEVWIGRLERGHALVKMPGNVVVRLARGEPKKVGIEVECRQNRKKFVTRVRGLEEYGIDAASFADDVSKRFACSATVETDPRGRAALKKGRVELVFQGNLSEELTALLLGDERRSSHGGAKGGEYCLPKGAIDVKTGKGVPTTKKKKRR